MSITDASPVEQRIIEALVSRALASGYVVSVNDGEEDTEVQRSTDKAAILAAMATTEEDYLVLHRADDGKRVGFVRLIYGNGEDVISDHTDKPELYALTDGAADEALDV